VGQHLAAGGFALATLFGAAGHHLVVFAMAFAFGGAARTRLGTGAADQVGRHALAGDDLGGRRAKRGAVDAGFQRLEMMGASFRQGLRAIRRTAVALPLAIGTGPRTFVVHRCGRVGGDKGAFIGRCKTFEGGERGRGETGRGEVTSANHDRISGRRLEL